MKRRPKSRFVNFLLLTGATILALPAVAAAQTAPEPGAVSGQEEEIIVTGQRRDQRLEEYPGSVSTLSTAELERSGAETIEDLQFRVPGFSLVNFYPGAQQLQLRGISSNSGLPTVGVYLDEMPISFDNQQGGLELDLRDMARVEVLRGPQGTLYGEGSMGGTIKYITASPDLALFGGELGVEYASINDGGALSRVFGTLNVPLIENELGIRVVASTEGNDGWIDNPLVGGEDVNSSDRVNYRIKTLWRPTDRLEASLLYARGVISLDNTNISGLNRSSQLATTTPVEDEYQLANAIVSYDFGPLRLTSSTGYVDRSNDARLDFSPSFVPLLQFFNPAGTYAASGIRGITDYSIFTQELRLNSTSDGPLKWTLGAYYRDYQADSAGRSFSEPDPPPFTLFDTDSTIQSESFAVFGEASYRITPQLEATLGARYFEDSRSQQTGAVVFGFPSSDTGADTFDSLNPRIALLYNFGQRSSVYASAAKGFRSGGFNSQSSGGGLPVPPTYDPEELLSYEVGGVFGVDRLLLQWAVYYNDWSNIQTFAFLPGSPFTIIANGGAASGLGLDAEANWSVTDALQLSASVSANNMQYDSTTADKLPGDPIDYVTPLTASSAITYNFLLGPGIESYVRGEVQYTDAFTVFIRNFGGSPVSSDARSTVNLSAGASLDNWTTRIYVNNLFDSDDVAMPATGSLVEPVRTRPRTIGVELRRQF